MCAHAEERVGAGEGGAAGDFWGVVEHFTDLLKSKEALAKAQSLVYSYSLARISSTGIVFPGALSEQHSSGAAA